MHVTSFICISFSQLDSMKGSLWTFVIRSHILIFQLQHTSCSDILQYSCALYTEKGLVDTMHCAFMLCMCVYNIAHALSAT